MKDARMESGRGTKVVGLTVFHDLKPCGHRAVGEDTARSDDRILCHHAVVELTSAVHDTTTTDQTNKRKKGENRGDELGFHSNAIHEDGVNEFDVVAEPGVATHNALLHRTAAADLDTRTHHRTGADLAREIGRAHV